MPTLRSLGRRWGRRWGPDDRLILAVAVPAFLALISEPLMLLADTAIVGHLGRTELAGLAAASAVLTTIVGLCVFLAYGSTAAVARQQGAGEQRRALTLAVSGVWLALALGVVLALATWSTAAPVARAVAGTTDVGALGADYLRIAAAGVPAMLLVLAATGGLRGLLDLRTPLVAMIVANVVNVVLSLALVYGLGLGLRGAALGLVLAQWLAAAWLCGALLLRARSAAATLRPDPAEIARAGLDGMPLFVRTVLLRSSLIIAVVVAGRLGDAPLAAQQIATTIVTLLAFALDAIAIAGQTLTGTSLGAGDFARTRALTRRMMGWGLASGVLGGVLLAVTAPWLVQLLTPDATVRDIALPALLVVAATQPVSGVVFVLDGVLIGAGDGVYLAWTGLLQLAVYAPAACAVGWFELSFTWLWAAYALYQLSRLATLWYRQRQDAWLT